MPDKLTSASVERLGRTYSRRNAVPAPSLCTVRGSPPPSTRRFSSPQVNSAALMITSSSDSGPCPRSDSLDLARRRMGHSRRGSSRRSPSPSPPPSPRTIVPRRSQAVTPPRSILRRRSGPATAASVIPRLEAGGHSTANDLLIVTSSALQELEKDEEATMAVVDCGHLAMCKECSNGVMSSSRACPLCRKSISAARLIRIFKT
ncbi:hypothetical protein K438DRAFT_1853673 [Mycena galopus ATCC 62051]|nr:hypothetical protein K438DRAFT_1853673 [Mycena galopus ATCC 62051]